MGGTRGVTRDIAVLAIYLDVRRIGRLYSQTFELRTREGAAREPDIVIVLNEHLDRVEDVRIRRAADLAVEIISPDSVTRDRRDKLAEYAAAGVPEHWLVDPRESKQSWELFVLDAEGRYIAAAPDSEGKLRSSVLPGVWAESRWLLLDELPSVIQLGMAMADAGNVEAP